ncbi:MAG: energy-coupling factor ABC transporter ATP-binding protein [Coriobacteriales bacterium]|jgi:cobalt/nickel transport system ATP-binding protein|nr:energy-coupling factor ABC transporter ATP-binding protein [Coriobacteriales bacterium]
MTCKISYEHVNYTYADGTRALDDVSFSLAHGEHVALLGPNGAGKSTAMLLSNGILTPDSGVIRVGTVELAKDTLVQIRQRVGLLFQDPDDQLFMTSVYDDVAFGPRNQGLGNDEVQLRVTEALDAVGFAGAPGAFIHKAPQELSFGQKKRVALATVLAMQPDFLILDEPSSNLDPRSRRQMMRLLDGLDHTIILATHDLDLAWELCPRTILLDTGHIVADGPTKDVLSDEALMDAHGLELPLSAKLAKFSALASD